MPSEDRSRLVAVLALLATCVLWGTSFATVKTCGEVLLAGAGPNTSAAFGPVMLTALRFTVALPIVLVFWIGRGSWGRLRLDNLAALLKVALPMTAGFIIQAIALAYTTATISAFLTSLVVLLTPFLEWIVLGKATTWRLVAAVALATAAVALMTLPGGRGKGVAFGLGEILTLVCVVAYSFQVLWTGQAANRIGAGVLTFASFAIVALASWLVLLTVWPTRIPGAVSAALASREFLKLFALMVLGATIGAMGLMNAFQRYVRPTEASIIYTTEPVFAAIFAWAIRGRSEALGPLGLVGAALMLVADLVAAVRFGGERRLTRGPTPERSATHRNPGRPSRMRAE